MTISGGLVRVSEIFIPEKVHRHVEKNKPKRSKKMKEVAEGLR